MEVSWQAWALGAAGAVCVGLGKGGLPGIGNLAIVLFALAFGPKASVGLLLPVLSCADVVAILIYRRHASWRHIGRLFPAAAVGVIVGFFLFDAIEVAVFSRVIGSLLLALTALHFVRQGWLRRKSGSGGEALPNSRAFAWSTGIVGGVATMLANAAGPIAALYLMAMRLPKFAFVGTAAWFFFLVNLFKVPFQVGLGTITVASIRTSLVLGMVAAMACSLAPRILARIPQKRFEQVVWLVVIVAALQMLLSGGG